MRTRHLILTLLIGACAGGGSAVTSTPDVTPAPTATSPQPDTVQVEASGFLFAPQSVTVAVGTTVEFVNQDDIDHTVTSGAPDGPDGVFDLALPEKGATASFTFDTPGSYPYFCTIHNHMRGVVEVTGP